MILLPRQIIFKMNIWKLFSFTTSAFCVLTGLLFCASCSTRQSETVGVAAPDSLQNFEVLIDKGDVFDGFILVRKITDPGAQLMLDSRGKVVWFQISDTAIFRPFQAFDDRYLALYSDRVIHEISYAGDTLLNLRYGQNDFDRTLHHEIVLDSDNNILALTKEIVPVDLTSVGGTANDTVVTDGIIKLSRKGEKLWSWSLDQVMDPLDFPDILKDKKDWGHANALFEDEDGNYLISWRDFNQIWKINSTTGDVIWKYGGETIADEDERFYKQHTIHRNLDGDYMLFDNGDKDKRSTSRAVAFSIENNEVFKQTLSIELPDSLFSAKQGSVYQIERDKFLFSSPMKHYLLITDRSGEILWMVRGTEPYYRAEYLENFKQ